jgi:hypothetical protein
MLAGSAMIALAACTHAPSGSEAGILPPATAAVLDGRAVATVTPVEARSLADLPGGRSAWWGTRMPLTTDDPTMAATATVAPAPPLNVAGSHPAAQSPINPAAGSPYTGASTRTNESNAPGASLGANDVNNNDPVAKMTTGGR